MLRCEKHNILEVFQYLILTDIYNNMIILSMHVF